MPMAIFNSYVSLPEGITFQGDHWMTCVTWDLCILVQDYQQNAAHEGKVLSLLRLRGGRGTTESLWVAPGETRPEKISSVIKHGVLENSPFIDFLWFSASKKRSI